MEMKCAIRTKQDVVKDEVWNRHGKKVCCCYGSFCKFNHICCQNVGVDSNILASQADHQTYHLGSRHNEIQTAHFITHAHASHLHTGVTFLWTISHVARAYLERRE